MKELTVTTTYHEVLEHDIQNVSIGYRKAENGFVICLQSCFVQSYTEIRSDSTKIETEKATRTISLDLTKEEKAEVLPILVRLALKKINE